jgi:hypothetical protein
MLEVTEAFDIPNCRAKDVPEEALYAYTCGLKIAYTLDGAIPEEWRELIQECHTKHHREQHPTQRDGWLMEFNTWTDTQGKQHPESANCDCIVEA